MKVLHALAFAGLLTVVAAEARADDDQARTEPALPGVETASPSPAGIQSPAGRIVINDPEIARSLGPDAAEILIKSAGGQQIVINPQALRAAGQPVGPRPARPFPVDRSILILAAAVVFAAAAGAMHFFPRSREGVASPPSSTQSLDLSQTNYRILRVIGEGGMGIVYEAMDRSLDRRVAIKRLRAAVGQELGALDQFLAEAKTVAALRHPAIPEIYSVAAQAGQIYLVFEFVQGNTLAQILSQRKRFTLEETAKLLHPICHALAFAHERKVIHRDLKPSNVMISDQGAVKVMDFGIARRLNQSLPRSGNPTLETHLTQTISGTPLYMALEAEDGMVCRESDIYSLAVMTYELLSGVPPFLGPNISAKKNARAYRRLSECIPGIPPAIDGIIDRSLEPNPEKRPHSSAEFYNPFRQSLTKPIA